MALATTVSRSRERLKKLPWVPPETLLQGDCWRESVCYELWCEECGARVCSYKGESGRNGYTRGGEHLNNLETRDEEKSVLWLHSLHHHQGRVDVVYRMRTTGSYADPLDRQLQERVNTVSYTHLTLPTTPYV